MADRIWIDNGKASIMCVGEEPWHGLGKTLDNPATAAEAIEAANLDWTVKKVQLYAWGDGVAYPMDETFTVVPEHRWGQLKCPTWGIVGSNYTPLQNKDAFEFFDRIVGEGAAIYHTAGALDDGRRIWILAKLPEDIVVAGKDITSKYLLLSNSHDGSGSVQIKFTPIRVVCHNTLTQALDEGDRAIRVSHTGNLKERMNEARRNLQLIRTTYDEIERHFAAMATVQLDKDQLDKYVAHVFPEPRKKESREIEKVEKDRARASRLFTAGIGNDMPGVAGTLWAAYNGIAEMVDHGRNRRTKDQHLEYIWFGGGSSIKAQAFKHAKAMMAELRV